MEDAVWVGDSRTEAPRLPVITEEVKQLAENGGDGSLYRVQTVDDIRLVTMLHDPLGQKSSDVVVENVSTGLLDLAKSNPSNSHMVLIDTLPENVENYAHQNFSQAGKNIGLWYKYSHANGNETTVVNVDHHAPEIWNARQVSSGTYAFRAELFRPGVFGKNSDWELVITHTDTDSVLTAMMLSGKVPREFYQEAHQAVIAADHTGEASNLGDLLSASQYAHDLSLSVGLVDAYFDARRKEGSAFDFHTFLENRPEQVESQNGTKISIAGAVKEHQEERSLAGAADFFHGKESIIARELEDLEMMNQEQIDAVFIGYDQKLEEARRAYLENPSNSLKPSDTVKGEEVHEMAVKLFRSEEGYALSYAGNGVFYLDGEAVQKTAIESEFLSKIIPPKLASQCKIIVSSSPYVDFHDDDRSFRVEDGQQVNELKMRVFDGVESVSLLDLDVQGVLGFGSRWNAGSNYRNGGSLHHGLEMAIYAADTLHHKETT